MGRKRSRKKGGVYEPKKLAFLLGYADVDRLVQEVDQTWRDTRERFERIFNEAAAE